MANAAVEVAPVGATGGAKVLARRPWLGPALSLVALFLAGVAAAGAVSIFVFERLPHVEDEHAFIFQARVFADGRLYVPTPASVDMFPVQFVLDRDGRRFGKYPPGYPLVLAAGVLAGQPWLVNPLLAGLGLVTIALLGRLLYDWGTGALAAALGLVSPFFLITAGSFMSHPASLLWLGLFALCLLTAVKHPERWGRWLLPAAGACLALGFITRPLTALGVAPPLLAAAVAAEWRRPRRLLAWALLGLDGAAPVLAFFFFWNTQALGGPFRNGYELWWDWDRIGFGAGPGYNFTPGNGFDNLKLNLEFLSSWLYGWPGRTSLVLPLLPFATLSRNRWDWLLLGWAASLAAVHILYWTHGEMYGPRYLYEALPPLLLLSARGLARLSVLCRRLLGRWEALVRAARGAVAGTLAALILLSGVQFLSEKAAKYHGWYNIHGEVFTRVNDAVERPAVVFVQPKAWTDYANFSWANDPLLGGPVVYAVDLGPERARRLLTELPPTETPRHLYRYGPDGLGPYPLPP